MKINNSSLPRPAQSEPAKVGKSATSEPAGNAARAKDVEVSLSTSASETVDQAKISEIRRAIQEGRLEIDAGRIADSLIDSTRSFMGESV